MTPRLMSRATAARYCDCTLATFTRWVTVGIMPLPIPGTHKWDRKAIDRALDQISGIQTTIQPSDPYVVWKAKDESTA